MHHGERHTAAAIWSVLPKVTRPKSSAVKCGYVVCSVSAAELQSTRTLMENTRITTIPHSSFGDPDCCGCLDPFIGGDEVLHTV